MTAVLAECSDDEEFEKCGISHGNYWGPNPQELEKFYELITSKKVLELNWKCPGMRDPSDEEKTPQEKDEPEELPENEKESNDFDFKEESTPFLRRVPGKPNLLKGSAKKKTTSLAGILSNMQRHRKINETGAEVNKETTNGVNQ